MFELQRKYIIGAIVGIVLIIGLAIFVSTGRNGTLAITASKNIADKTEVTVSITRDGEEVRTFNLKAGETERLKLGSGSIRIDSAAGDLTAIDVVDIKGRATTTLTVPQAEQRAIKQIGSEVDNCITTIKSVAYSYPCEGEGRILQHSQNGYGASLNNLMFNGETFGTLKPYKDGFLGARSVFENIAPVLFLNPATGETTILKLPNNIQVIANGETPTIAVPTAAGATRFALMFPSANKIYLFQDIDDDKPAEIKLTDDIALNELTRLARITFANNNLIVYAGQSSHQGEGEPDQEADEADKQEIPVRLLEYDGSGVQLNSFELPDEIRGAQTFTKVGRSYYAASTPYTTEFFYAEGNKLVHSYTLEDVTSWTNYDGKAYIMANGKIYEFEPGNTKAFSMHGVYASEDITASALYTGPEGVLFTGFTKLNESEGNISAYQLLSTRADNQGNTGNNGEDVPASRSAIEPSYPGMDGLYEIGITENQIINLRYALGDYGQKSGAYPTEIGISDIVHTPRSRFSESMIENATFTVSFNTGQIFRANMDYWSLKSVNLRLYDATNGALTYQSGEISNEADQ